MTTQDIGQFTTEQSRARSLIGGRLAAVTSEQAFRASRFVASQARDAGDAAVLLAMLGLDPANGKAAA